MILKSFISKVKTMISHHKQLGFFSLIIFIIILAVAITILLQPKHINEFFDLPQSLFSSDEIHDNNTPSIAQSHVNVTEIQGSAKGISVTIKNDGDVIASNVQYSIIVQKHGLLKRQKTLKSEEGTIDILAPGEEMVISTPRILGLGKITVTVTIESEEITVEGRQIFIFTRITGLPQSLQQDNNTKPASLSDVVLLLRERFQRFRLS